MRTRKEIARQNISKSDLATKANLILQGYSVLRKSKSTVIMVLWGDEKTAEEIDKEIDKKKAGVAAAMAIIQKEQAIRSKIKVEIKEAAKLEVTISNLWRNFNRNPHAYMNVKRDSFYFQTATGKKVRISNHESWHFQLDSDKSLFSRAADFCAPDYDFTLDEFEGKTRAEVVEIVKNAIK